MYDDDVCMIKNYDKITIKNNQWERLWHHIVTFRVFTHVATLGFHDTELIFEATEAIIVQQNLLINLSDTSHIANTILSIKMIAKLNVRVIFTKIQPLGVLRLISFGMIFYSCKYV